MPLKLSLEERDRLHALQAGRGERRGKGVFTSRPGHIKTTAEEIAKVKLWLDTEKSISQIATTAGVSEFVVRKVKHGGYD